MKGYTNTNQPTTIRNLNTQKKPNKTNDPFFLVWVKMAKYIVIDLKCTVSTCLPVEKMKK